MKKEIDSIVLKIENGRANLTYKDMRVITDLLYRSMGTINAISRISSNQDSSTSSNECTLKSIRELVSDFNW